MSISQIQRHRVFGETTRTLFSSGERPRLVDIMREVSGYFHEYPAGKPLPALTKTMQKNLPSNVTAFNQMLSHVVTNLDVLYEATEEHQQDTLLLTTLLKTNLERLRARRKKLVTQIDDYLFSLYNTDGYYYSISDVFSDLNLTDLNLTSAFVDTYSGYVSLPTISHLTKRVEPKMYSGTAITASAPSSGDGVLTYNTLSPFQGCVDGLTNTIWAIEVERDQPEEIVVNIMVTLAESQSSVKVSKIEYDPYGITPVQMWIETESYRTDNLQTIQVEDFGNGVKKSQYKMTFVDQPRVVKSVNFWLRKTEPDYTVEKDNKTKYRYIFAAKDITMTEHVYDNQATFVSAALSLPEEIAGDNVIDAVSLVATDHTPTDTSISYFVASDIEGATDVSDFTWFPIDKIDNLNPKEESIFRFEGALKFSSTIRANPSDGDLLLKAFVSAGITEALNPNPNIIPGVDIYRLAVFSDEVLTKSIILEEGVNTTKILHVDPESGVSDEEALELSYWKDHIDGTKINADTVYGRIDIGNGFFSGGDVGEHNKRIYVETYIESLTDQETMLKRLVKADTNSRVWDVKVYLNGREVGMLPVGVDELVIPWKFQKGLNHIALVVIIPPSTGAFPSPQNGLINLFDDSNLQDFGIVKLGTWTYVDFFKMQYNENGDPRTFTIYDGEIISRRKPTDNFRLKYSKARSTAPDAIRLRADLKRTTNNQFVSPYVDLYRLRFIYT